MIAIARQPQKVRARGCRRKFLQLLPRIRSCARYAFRALKRGEREEAVADVVAAAYCAFHRLVQLGKADLAYATPLVRFAVAQYWSGRRAATPMNSSDVLSPITAHRKRVRVFSFTAEDREDEWAETLVDNSRSPIPDQAAFRVDFPIWLSRLNDRDRRLAEFLVVGNSTCEAAEQFGLSWGRVSQLRGTLRKDWQSFHGEVEQDVAEISSISK